jgi:hypothetical protein
VLREARIKAIPGVINMFGSPGSKRRIKKTIGEKTSKADPSNKIGRAKSISLEK